MKNVIFTAIVAALALASCNKGGNTSNYRVKSFTSGKGQTTQFFYTPDNKLDKIKTSDSVHVEFTYNGNTVTQKATDEVHGQSMSTTYYLSPGGYTDSAVTNSPMGAYVKAETHDADGYTTVTNEYMAGSLRKVTKYSFKDGNETIRTICGPDSKPQATVYFEYYPDKFNTITPENRGQKYLARESKNLMKKYVQVMERGDTAGVGNFSYQFDDKGRVKSQSTYDAKTGMRIDSVTVTYY